MTVPPGLADKRIRMSARRTLTVWVALAAILQLALAPRTVASPDCASDHGGCCMVAPLPPPADEAPAPQSRAGSHTCCHPDAEPAIPAPRPDRDDDGCPCEHDQAPPPPAQPETVVDFQLPVLLPAPWTSSVVIPTGCTILAAPGARPPDATGPPRFLRFCSFLI